MFLVLWVRKQNFLMFASLQRRENWLLEGWTELKCHLQFFSYTEHSLEFTFVSATGMRHLFGFSVGITSSRLWLLQQLVTTWTFHSYLQLKKKLTHPALFFPYSVPLRPTLACPFFWLLWLVSKKCNNFTYLGNSSTWVAFL